MVDCPFARGWASVQRACGLHGNRRRQPAWLPLFRRAGRVYVAVDRDATDRAIALARTFGTRGRVLIPRDKTWPEGRPQRLAGGAKGDPAAFRSVLDRALAMSPNALGASDPVVTIEPCALGSGGPSGRARPPMRARPPGTAQPRCAPALAGGAMRGGA
jgi:hypothetical protein